MDVSKANRPSFPASSSAIPDGCITVRLDPEDAGRLSRMLLDLLSDEAVASVVTPVGFDKQAMLTITLAQLRRQLRQL